MGFPYRGSGDTGDFSNVSVGHRGPDVSDFSEYNEFPRVVERIRKMCIRKNRRDWAIRTRRRRNLEGASVWKPM